MNSKRMTNGQQKDIKRINHLNGPSAFLFPSVCHAIIRLLPFCIFQSFCNPFAIPSFCYPFGSMVPNLRELIVRWKGEVSLGDIQVGAERNLAQHHHIQQNLEVCQAKLGTHIEEKLFLLDMNSPFSGKDNLVILVSLPCHLLPFLFCPSLP